MAESKIEKYKQSVDATAAKHDFEESDVHLYSRKVQDSNSPTGESTHDNFFYERWQGADTSEFVAHGDGAVPDEMMAIFDAICEADVKLVEVPIYRKIITVSDFPPAPPEVDIVPLNDRENEIKINFFPGTVGRELLPIIINDSDKEIFGRIRMAQDRNLIKSLEDLPAGFIPPQAYKTFVEKYTSEMYLSNKYYVEPKLIFKSDDFVTHHELYRLETPPVSYRDFENNRIALLSSKDESSYIDNIEENKKYYYTFRSIDVHGNLSNPSPIYEVEMVENSGVYYPVISVYQLEQEPQNFKSKPFKRFLKINAAPLQKAVDYDAPWWNKGSVGASDLSYINLGDAAIPGHQQIFNHISEQGGDSGNKKFKFRLKSRHTGKTIDLNVKFKLRKPQTNESILSCGEAGYIEKTYPETE